jgi:hypothetical protein
LTSRPQATATFKFSEFKSSKYKFSEFSPARSGATTMSCPAITLTGITTEKYQTLLAKAAAQGLELAGPSGSTGFQGMQFTWNYDAASDSLTIQCTDKPIFVPCSMIESRIRSLMS